MFTRHHVPFIELNKRGFDTGFVSIRGYHFDEVIEDNDLIIFTRVYNTDPFRHIWRFKSEGKKIIYELDDDVWNIPAVNPAHNTFKIKKDEVTDMCLEADAIIVSTEALAETIKALPRMGNKPIFVCPNAVNRDMFKPRQKQKRDRVRIGWAGGGNHYEDLDELLDVWLEIDKKYDVEFIIQGLTGTPLEAEMFNKAQTLKRGSVTDKATKEYMETALRVWDKVKQLKNFQHIPFYPAEMYPSVLTNCDFDIGIAYTTKHKFNASKSCIKFYEYAAVGTPTMASFNPPYKNEVSYTAKDKKEWVEKLSRLVESEELREKVLKEQQEYVFNNREISVVGDIWEQTYEKINKL